MKRSFKLVQFCEEPESRAEAFSACLERCGLELSSPWFAFSWFNL